MANSGEVTYDGIVIKKERIRPSSSEHDPGLFIDLDSEFPEIKGIPAHVVKDLRRAGPNRPGGRTTSTTSRPVPKTPSQKPRFTSKKSSNGVKKTASKSFKSTARKSKNSGVTGIGDDDEIADYDAIEAYEAEDEAPSIEATTKKAQLKAMLEGCPEGSNMYQNRKDRAAIERATRTFSGRKVFAKDGRWVIDDMDAGNFALFSKSPFIDLIIKHSSTTSY